MDEYTKQLIEEARATYKDVVAGDDSRIQRGKILWDQFEAAAEACRTGGKESERQLGQRINELAAAKVLADDKQRVVSAKHRSHRARHRAPRTTRIRSGRSEYSRSMRNAHWVYQGDIGLPLRFGRFQ